jgi:hypothetical protein
VPPTPALRVAAAEAGGAAVIAVDGTVDDGNGDDDTGDDAGENGSGAAAVSRNGAGSRTGAESRYEGGGEEIGALLAAANGAGGIDAAGIDVVAAAAGAAVAVERGSVLVGGVEGTR